jgi:hypothetical protein
MNEAAKKKFTVSLVCIVLICTLVMSAILSVPVLATSLSNAIPGAAVHGENAVVVTITATVTVAGVPYVFEDPQRGTKLYIDIGDETFRFTAPDGYDSGIVWAQRMRVKDDGRVTIHHNDSSLRFDCRANTTTDFCSGLLTNKENKSKYRILDPEGVD